MRVCFAGSRCLTKFGGGLCYGNELARFFAQAAEHYYLVCNSLLNELHQYLVFERFCKECKSSRIERGLAH